MKRSHRGISAILAVVLFLGLSLPMPVSAASLYFTALNDNVPPLNAGTMPVRTGGNYYMPYSVFDANLNVSGVSLGLYTSYNRSANTVTLFNLRRMVVFDLNNGTCRDDMTGATYSAGAIMRNGRPYLNLDLVCQYFGLQYSVNALPYITQGYLMRIKSADAVLSDAQFIESAKNLINDRLREYTQSLNPTEPTDPGETTGPAQPPEVDERDVATYLAFRCESADGLESMLAALDNAGRYAVFFMTPELIRESGPIVRRILGTGHSMGVLAESASDLERGRSALEEIAHTRSTLAYVPAELREEAGEDGWICWNETLFQAPSDTVSGGTFAANTINRLGGRRSVVYLTVESGVNAARVLPTLLRQLNSNHFTVAIPLETRL